MKKTIITIVRTMLAVAAIIGFTFLGKFAFNWQTWCPNGDLGSVLVITMLGVAVMGIVMGFYGISPIFWKAVIGITCARIKDDVAYIDDARKDIRHLRKTWAW